jgi:hypothetical protein
MGTLISKIQKYYEKREIKNMHELFKDSFKTYFLKKGYEIKNPAPLISQEDKTVIFTGSSTNVVKPQIINGNYSKKKGFIVNQECLRNHALEHAFDNSWLPFGQAYFNISSVLSKPGRFSEVIEEATGFTTKYLGISPSKVKIKSTKKSNKLNKIDKIADLRVEYDTHKREYYRWRYGIQNIYGEGVTINLQNTSENSSLDVGNIIRILDNENKERGIEFGYGHEFFLSAALGIKNPLELSQVFEIFPFKPDLSCKYYGYLEVIVRIKKSKNQNIKMNRSAKRTYKKYLRSALYMGNLLGKDIEEILLEIEKIYQNFNPTDTNSNFDLEKRILSK